MKMTDSEMIAERLMDMVGETRAAKTHDGNQYRSPTSWVMTGSASSTAGVVVTENSSLSISSVFACVRNIAEDEGKLPFIVYRRTDPMGKERLPAHPLYRLMHDNPNSEMTPLDFRQAVTACAVLWGGGYAEIERDNSGTPIALWPVEPWRVVPRRDQSGVLYYEIDGGRTRLSIDDILHIKGFGTDGIVGMMMAHVGRESLGLTIAAQRFAASFFGNGARLTGILKHPGKLSDNAHRHLRESFTDQHGGPDRAHGVGVLEEGTEWIQTSSAPEEAQMLETRQFQVEDVARWFRMPPHKIQHLARSTFSNIEHQSIEYVTDTLMPWLVKWEQETKKKLVKPDEKEVFGEHLVDALMRGDTLSRYQAYAVGRQNGWLNGNDIREKENMNPIDGGDSYLVNGNMITVAKAVAQEPTAVKGGTTNSIATTGSESDSAETRTAIIEAHRPALADAASRAVRREVEVIRRKAKNLDKAKDAVVAFYETHGDYVRNSIKPALQAFRRTLDPCGSFDIDLCVRSIADSHLGSSRSEILEALSGSPDADTIDAVLGEWESRHVNLIVENIIQSANTRTV